MKKYLIVFSLLIFLPSQASSNTLKPIPQSFANTGPGIGTKVFAGVKSGTQFCLLTGTAIGYLANVSQVLVNSIGVSTKQGEPGEWFMGGIALTFSYIFIRYVSYPWSKRTYEGATQISKQSSSSLKRGGL